MKRALVLTVICAAVPVAAQPVTRPDICGATIAYAPDEVRDVVEGWIRKEAHCNVALEVRIVPTDGGLYLFARDERGYVRERIVPDAQAAAVLVTSWLADDSRPPPPPRIEFPPRVPPPDYTVDPFDAAPSVATSAEPATWLGLGPVVLGHGRGLRGELDARTWGKWTLGIAAAVVEQDELIWPPEQGGFSVLEIFDIRAAAYFTRQSWLGNWRVRPQVALGFEYSRATLPMTDYGDPWNPRDASILEEGVLPLAEVSLVIGRGIGRNWAIDAGPMVTFVGRGPGFYERAPERSFFAAVRHRL